MKRTSCIFFLFLCLGCQNTIKPSNISVVSAQPSSNFSNTTITEQNKKENAVDYTPFFETNYYPFAVENVIELGRGFNPFHLDQPKLFPFQFVLKEETHTAIETNFQVSIAFNKYDLEKALDFNSTLKLSLGTVKANAFYKTITKTTFDESSISVIIKASTEYSKISLDITGLTTEASETYKRDIKEFSKKYGTRIPIQMRRGAAVYFVLNIKNVSETFRNEVTSNLSVSKSGMFFSGSIEANLKKEITESRKNNRLEVEILSRGGQNGIGDLSDMVKAFDDETNSFKNLKESLAQYFKTFKVENSVPVGYFTASYKSLGYSDALTELTDVSKEKYLIKIVDFFQKANDDLNKLQLIDNCLDPICQALSDKSRTEIHNTTIPQLTQYIDFLTTVYQLALDKDPSQVDFSKEEIPMEPEISIFKDFAINLKVTNNEMSDTRNSVDYDYLLTAPYLQEVNLKLGDLSNSVASPIQVLNATQFPAPTNQVMSATLISRDVLKINSAYFKGQTFTSLAATTSVSPNGTDFYLEVKNMFNIARLFRIGRIYKDAASNQYSVYLYKTVNY